MVIVKRYDPTHTYMFPNGSLATPEAVLEQFPAVNTFTHFIETDGADEILWAVQALNAMRAHYGIDPALPEGEAIEEIGRIRNAPPPEPGPSAEERIAAALEFQNILAMLPIFGEGS